MSAEQLRLRRNPEAKRRAQEEAGARPSPVVESPPARPLPETEQAWRELVASARSGYDPWVMGGGFTFDVASANHACEWIESHCRHIKGELAGQLIRMEGWQRAYVGTLFGWKRPNGTRRYRESMLYVPRKNGKSTVAASLALYVFFEDREPGAEVFTAAAKRDQAKIVWGLCRRMIQRDTELNARAKCMQHVVLIEDDDRALVPISADATKEHGANIHCCVVDELHAQPDSELVEVIQTAMGARRQPLLVHLTTADEAGRESVCNAKLEYARAVRDNPADEHRPGYDPSFLPWIYEATRDDDWTDPKVWAKANPCLGVSLSREYLERECRRAKDDPAYMTTFRRLHLNVQVEAAVAWLPMDKWDGPCAQLPDLSRLKELPCYAGIDLSSTTDMTSVVLYWPDLQYVLPHYWVPREAAKEYEKRNRPLYMKWAAAGHLTLTDGNVVDYGRVIERLDDLRKTYRLVAEGIDPWNSRQLSQDLEKRGHTIYEVRQGPVTLNEPSKRLHALVASGQLRHGGHPVLRWNAAHVKAKTDEKGNICPVKPKGEAKVDGIVALVCAIAVSMFAPAKPSSVYETREPLILE